MTDQSHPPTNWLIVIRDGAKDDVKRWAGHDDWLFIVSKPGSPPLSFGLPEESVVANALPKLGIADGSTLIFREPIGDEAIAHAKECLSVLVDGSRPGSWFVWAHTGLKKPPNHSTTIWNERLLSNFTIMRPLASRCEWYTLGAKADGDPSSKIDDAAKDVRAAFDQKRPANVDAILCEARSILDGGTQIADKVAELRALFPLFLEIGDRDDPPSRASLEEAGRTLRGGTSDLLAELTSGNVADFRDRFRALSDEVTKALCDKIATPVGGGGP